MTIRDKQRRPAVRIAGACLMLCAAASIAGCSGVAEPVFVEGAGEVWSIGVNDPRFAGDERCTGDPAIDTSVSTADLPTSRMGITLALDATEDDALRIAECLRDALSSGEIIIRPPATR